MNSTVSTSQGFLPQARHGSLESSNVLASNSLGQPELESNGSNEVELISASWNQDYGCFAAGTSHGFRIYNCEPFKETFRRDLKSGDSKSLRCCSGATFWHLSEVRSVKLRRDRIVVVLEHKLYVYNFMDLKLLHQIETLANPRGLCCLSHDSNTFVLACPGLHRGQVRIEHFGLNVMKLLNAHDSHIACLTLTMDGLLLATASTRGTLIRIFNTMDGTRLQEVRRGVDRAEIYGIALSRNVQWLAVSSDKGTVHIFSLRVRVAGEDSSSHPSPAQGLALLDQNSSSSLDGLISPSTSANPGSSLSFMRGVLPKYFSSEWSFAQFHLSEDTQYIAAFASQNTVIIVGMNGRCSFDPVHGGHMLQQEYVRFLQTESRPG
uniref:Autophagy-related protein 18d-like n=1 Tax=Populus alba TaxID=43335 RepID=A0A4U5QGX4_POPAL|nr:hypothetical protein D5086_0000109790 [Populus alba]